jgi:hypothetical protein
LPDFNNLKPENPRTMEDGRIKTQMAIKASDNFKKFKVYHQGRGVMDQDEEK